MEKNRIRYGALLVPSVVLTLVAVLPLQKGDADRSDRVAALLKRTRSFLPHSLCLFASTLVMAPFVSNSIGLYLAVLAALFLLSEILFVKVRE